MIVFVIINMYLAFVLEPAVIKKEDKCALALVLYYSFCLSATFIGGIILYSVISKILRPSGDCGKHPIFGN